jgi:hypothetical protein
MLSLSKIPTLGGYAEARTPQFAVGGHSVTRPDDLKRERTLETRGVMAVRRGGVGQRPLVGSLLLS